MKLTNSMATLGLALAVSPTWAVNKCTGPGGAVVYQEQSCTAADKAEVVKAPGRPLEDYELRERDALAKARLVCNMEQIPKYPEVGWLEARFMACTQIAVLRGADAVNVTESAAGQSKQFVYRYDGAYVYTRNGVVTAIQKRR